MFTATITNQIANQIINMVQPEVVIGGGYSPTGATTGSPYLSAADYALLANDATVYEFAKRSLGVDGGDALAEAGDKVKLADGEKLFGLFGTSAGNFDYYDPADQPGSPEFSRPIEDPTLAEAVRATLDVLSQDDDGMFVMFEQGDIDWSNHANNYEGMIGGEAFNLADLDANDPIFGYDPSRGGIAPERLDSYSEYVAHTLRDVLQGDRPMDSRWMQDVMRGMTYCASTGRGTLAVCRGELLPPRRTSPSRNAFSAASSTLKDHSWKKAFARAIL